MSKVTYDNYFVSTMNHLYKYSKRFIPAMLNEVFKQGTDFQKAYCSGLEDYMYHTEGIPIRHEHFRLAELCKPPIVNDGYNSSVEPIKEFLEYNVWVSEIGNVA